MISVLVKVVTDCSLCEIIVIGGYLSMLSVGCDLGTFVGCDFRTIVGCDFRTVVDILQS